MSQSEEKTRELLTRVGRISPTELHFRGHEVRELMGRSYWQLVSLSVGGPDLDSSACRRLDALTAAMLACDPRIWPLKVVQLAGAQGRAATALGVGILCMGASRLSYWRAGEAAQWLSRQKAEIAKAPDRVVESWSDEQPPAAFGVTGRHADQRVTLFREWQEAQSISSGRFESFLIALEPSVQLRYGASLRVDGLAGAVLLDAGLSAESIGMVAGVVSGLPNILANAHEGAQRGGELGDLAVGQVGYTGARPRQSSRAQAVEALGK